MKRRLFVKWLATSWLVGSDVPVARAPVILAIVEADFGPERVEASKSCFKVVSSFNYKLFTCR